MVLIKKGINKTQMNKHLLSLKMVGYKFSLFSLMILSSKQGTANYMLKEEETLQKKKNLKCEK